MRKRFKIPLMFIILLIASCSFVFVSYFYIYKPSYAMSVVSDYPLSINYSTGELIDNYNYEDVGFSVTNSSEEDLLFSLSFINVFCNENLNYLITSDEYNFSGVFESSDIADSLLIKSGESIHFTLNVETDGSIDFKGTLYITKIVTEELKFYQTIISDNDVSDSSVTEIGKEESSDSEGLVKLNADDGAIYYFRGNVENNYVEFAEYTWRIINVNSVGTVKLVLDSDLDLSSEYYSSDYDFLSSTVYEELTDWYDMYLSYYESILVDNNFCYDNSVVDSVNNVYGAYNRIINSLGATYECIGESVNSYIGLLAADEVVYAGATTKEENDSFYLYSENAYFTMTSAVLDEGVYYPFVVEEGMLAFSDKKSDEYFIKPVINIDKNIYATGSGTKDDPYVFSE